MSDRRQAMLEATLRLIDRRGADAVTHRAVAAEAGVPLAATTYHFSSKAALVREAFELVIAHSTELVERSTQVDGPLTDEQLADRLAAFAEAQRRDQRAPLAAQVELMLEAGRRPELQELARCWTAAYQAGLLRLMRAGDVEPATEAAELVSDLIEGALLNQLSLPRPRFRQRLRRSLTTALAGFETATAAR
jgi:DNA-binding transcriptional regulator YbjK